MRAVITRVNEASVTIGGQETARIDKGFLVLLGVHVSDTAAANGKMNVNPADAGAELLIVSQFTLFADCRSRRPGFTAAARPETAVPLYERVIAGCRARGFTVRTGEFGADMQVASVNDGPVTILPTRPRSSAPSSTPATSPTPSSTTSRTTTSPAAPSCSRTATMTTPVPSTPCTRRPARPCT